MVENVEMSMRARPVLDRQGNAVGEYVYAGQVANNALELLGKHLRMFPKDGAAVNLDNRTVNFTIGKGYDSEPSS